MKGKTVAEYRFEKDNSFNDNLKKSYKQIYQEKYPEYFAFIEEFQSKFYEHCSDDMTMGCDYSLYIHLTDHIFRFKPKHLIEYGPGFTTVLLHRISQDIDWGMKVFSYEDDEKWFEILKQNGFDVFGSMELVKMSVEDRDNFYYCTYEHDLEKHREVDYVFIDGPGEVIIDDIRKDNINLNLEKLLNFTGRKIPYLIDGRHHTQQHYKKLHGGIFPY